MSDPRFHPREMAAPSDRHNFGKVEAISWRECTTELDASQNGAARLQHALALIIAGRLRDKGHSIRSYAKLVGLGHDRMAKVLRGEVVMRLEDVSDAERLLGGIVHPLLARNLSFDDYSNLEVPVCHSKEGAETTASG